MANILYYTRPDFIYNAHSGGMGTKTKAIVEAWADGGIHKIDCASDLSPIQQADTAYDVVMLELLQIHNPETWAKDMELLKNFSGAVLVYGSDSELLRMPGHLISELLQHVDLWVPNCYWQANYFADFNLPVAEVVHEPIDTDLFHPSENVKKTIVAGGMISYGKQSDFFIELFEKLKEVKKEYQTAYIGSAGTWGDRYSAVNLELERELKKNVDIFYGLIPSVKVARAMGEAAVGVLNPFYETCNRVHMELMGTGKPTVCGVHVCYDERPVTKRFRSLDDCIDALKELTDDFTELPDKTLGAKEREHAETYFSYEASREQFNNVLRRVL